MITFIHLSDRDWGDFELLSRVLLYTCVCIYKMFIIFSFEHVEGCFFFNLDLLVLLLS